ncbi:MAG: pinensin family lanthipeptide [Cyclobacteriaceae bacterium]
MMKKKKLRLDELKVKSFVTVADEESAQTMKAGLKDTSIDQTDDGTVIINWNTRLNCGPTPGTWCYFCPVDF